jgi:vacuolar-type H+-ATPase subunit D/Vma8
LFKFDAVLCRVQVEDEPAREDIPVVRNQFAPHVHEEEMQDRYAMLKSRRDALIVRVYEAKREIASIQAEMDSLM